MGKNPQTDDLPVHRCRDGQELPSSVGERLCRFLWRQPDADLLAGSSLMFEPRLALVDITPAKPPLPAPTEAPLAIEDSKKRGDETNGNRSRPAPEKLGSFL